MADLRKRANLLPDHARPRERAIADTDGRFEDFDVDLVRRMRDPDRIDADDLRFLAWERSVDVWDPAWPDEVCRDVVKAAPTVHRYKGTVGAIKAALAALRVDVEVTEWWQTSPQGRPYTFRLTAFARARLYDGPVLDARLVRVVFQTVMAVKPLSRAFDLTVAAAMPACLGLAPIALARPRVSAALRPVSAEAATARLGLAPVALARPRVGVALRPAPVVEALAAPLGLAPVTLARSRVAVSFRASP